MARYIRQRLFTAAIVLVGISFVSFAFVYLLPGDPVTSRYPNITQSEREAIRDKLGLDDPLPVRYGTYISGLAEGDWGQSYNTGNDVIDDMRTRVPATLEVAIYAIMLAAALGVPLGIVAAVHRNGILDRVVRVLTTATISVPVFWSSLLLIYLFYYELRIAPAPVGRLPIQMSPPSEITGLYTVDALATGELDLFWVAAKQLALPVVALALFLLSPITRIARAAMIETLQQRYILTARALGVPGRTVLFRDALPNSLLSVITLLGFLFGYLVTGDALVEKVFSWPGLGLYAVNAVATSDHAVIQGALLIIAVAILTINLLVDLTYGVIDPRIRAQYQLP
jgi:ABC-type dipeptide/oligopeptide/nickel transport system permease component